MLLREDGDAVVAIGQASHAWLSGQLARAWAGDVEPREAVYLAAEQHDVGMAEWDLAPALNPQTRLPQTFMQMDLDVHIALWTAAPRKLLTQSSAAALLVSLHGTRLYEMRDVARMSPRDASAVRAYLDGQRALQEHLASETGLGWPVLRRLQRLISLWDALSLALCLRWAPWSAGVVPLGDGERELALDPRGDAHVLRPWPFVSREPLVVRCEGRRLEGRYEDEATLHAALRLAPRVELAFTLVER